MTKKRRGSRAAARQHHVVAEKRPPARSGPRQVLERLAGRVAGASASTYAIVAIVVIVTAVKLLVVSQQGMTVLGGAAVDDGLFVRAASYLRQGMWLGPYDWLTLAKGPAYPLWIAAVAALGIPLLGAQQVLYAFACGVLTLVVRPMLRSRWASVALYIALLLNPVTFADGAATRVLREGIYQSLTMLVVACAIATWVRADRSPRAWTGWAIGLGSSSAAFWLTREEGVWLTPILLLPVATVFMAVRSHGWSLRRISNDLRPWGLGAAVALLLVGAVAANNQRVYGVFQTVDTMSGGFVNAYGALARIEPRRWVPDVPVPKEVRLRAYAVSPTFALLEPSLEGTVGANWARISGSPEIKGGWFQWALRESTLHMGYNLTGGYYISAGQTEAFYQQVADELNAACADGRLDASPPRASLMPPWRGEYTKPFLSALARSARLLALFEGISTRASPSDISPSLWGEFTGTAIGSYAGLDPEPAGRETATAVLDFVLVAYQWLTPLALLVAITGAGITLADSVRRGAGGRAIASSILLAVIALLIAARCVLVALVDTTSFPAVGSLYLSPVHGLVILWVFLGSARLVGHLRERRASLSAR